MNRIMLILIIMVLAGCGSNSNSDHSEDSSMTDSSVMDTTDLNAAPTDTTVMKIDSAAVISP